MADINENSNKYNYNLYHIFFLTLIIIYATLLITLYNKAGGWSHFESLFKFPMIIMPFFLSLVVVFINKAYPAITIEYDGIKAFYRKFGSYYDTTIKFADLEYEGNNNNYLLFPAINFKSKQNKDRITVIFPNYIKNIDNFIDVLESKTEPQIQLRKDLNRPK